MELTKVTPRSLEAMYAKSQKIVYLERELAEKPHVWKNLEEKKDVKEVKPIVRNWGDPFNIYSLIEGKR